jgi:predicted RNA-binding protein
VCLATVYVEINGEKEEVMQDVAWIRPEGRGLRLISFIGESRFVQGEIKDIDLVKSSIVLERVTSDSRQPVSDDQQDQKRSELAGNWGEHRSLQGSIHGRVGSSTLIAQCGPAAA